jgi:hypothetical protein
VNRTLEDHLVTIGDDPSGNFVCHSCTAELPAFGLVQDGENWICGNCLIDRVRSDSEAVVLTWDDVRSERTRLLGLTDWTQNVDVSDAVSAKWKPIRQELRDITTDFADPNAAWEALRQLQLLYKF